VCLHAEIVVIIVILICQTFQLFQAADRQREERRDQMRLKFVFSVAVPPQLNHAVAVGNNSLISFCETWSSYSNCELKKTHI